MKLFIENWLKAIQMMVIPSWKGELYGLNSILPKFTHLHPGPHNVTNLKNEVIVDVITWIKVRLLH